MLLLDKPEYNNTFQRFLNDKGFDTRLIPTLKEAWELVMQGRLDKTDVTFIHKDLGDDAYEGKKLGISADDVVAKIQERAPHIRIVVISGEYPDGEDHVIHEMKADGYTDAGELRDFCLEQARKGPVSPKEIEKRGKEIAMPRFGGIETNSPNFNP